MKNDEFIASFMDFVYYLANRQRLNIPDEARAVRLDTFGKRLIV